MTGPEKLKWEGIFFAAFNREDFAGLLLGLDDSLAKYEGPNDNLQVVIRKVIGFYEQKGWQNRLLMAVLAARQDNPEIVELARSYGATSVPARQELETILSDSGSLLNFGVWLESAVKIQRAVCRVEIPLKMGGTAFGTGFLVGPDMVITNHHVIKPVLEAEAAANAVICRFDYRVMNDGGVSAGIVYQLAPEWRVSLSPNNRAGREPTADELDYAVLRLSRPAGTLSAGDKPDAPGTQRGWIKLPQDFKPPFGKDSPLFIVQHPQAAPIKLALKTNSVLAVNDTRTRVRHRTDTDRGSSGSPCFDQDWKLVALHHSGDPNFAFVYNEGIPVDTIVASLKNQGIPI
jgi:hypothetical protein